MIWLGFTIFSNHWSWLYLFSRIFLGSLIIFKNLRFEHSSFRFSQTPSSDLWKQNWRISSVWSFIRNTADELLSQMMIIALMTNLHLKYMLYTISFTCFIPFIYKDIERPIIFIWTFSSQVEGKDLRIAALEAQVLVSTSFPKTKHFLNILKMQKMAQRWLLSVGRTPRLRRRPPISKTSPSALAFLCGGTQMPDIVYHQKCLM